MGFLGLGAQPPTPDWGLMAAENRGILTVNPWASIAPALVIGMLSVGVSFIADGVTQIRFLSRRLPFSTEVRGLLADLSEPDSVPTKREDLIPARRRRSPMR